MAMIILDLLSLFIALVLFIVGVCAIWDACNILIDERRSPNARLADLWVPAVVLVICLGASGLLVRYALH
jgi:divalent metal cation (Fe/Co/Zn/Cd) transporter